VASDNAKTLRSFLEASFTDVSAFIDAAERGELDPLDPDVVYEDANLPDHVGEVYRGYDALIRAAGRWLETNDYIRLELQEIIEVGDDLVSVHNVSVRTSYTGIEDEALVAYVWKFRDGRVVHWQSYRTLTEALSAAGNRTAT
jgi:ketosteroid isomerase-like protein